MLPQMCSRAVKEAVFKNLATLAEEETIVNI